MSGFSHIAPFRHYHRIEDGTTYFAINGVIHSAPTEKDTIDGCKFDLDASLTIQDWESPSEFEPFRREVEEALGIAGPPPNYLERVRDVINGMNCEWKAAYDYPSFLGVYPRNPDIHDDGIAWSFDYDTNTQWGGCDRMTDNSVQLRYGLENECVPTRDDDPSLIAGLIIKHMREQAIKRVGWLGSFIEQCVAHIEATSATSPVTTGGPWAIVKGPKAYDEAWKLINTWRQS